MTHFEQTAEQMAQFLDFIEEDLENVRRALREVREKDIEAEFIVHQKSETIEESVESKGMDASSIVKTLVFMAGGKPVAVLCGGDSRVSEQKLEEVTGKNVDMASPSEVKEETGYTVGGVSPFDLDIPVYIDEDIMEKELVDAAAGSRVVGVELSPGELERVTGGEVVDVSG